ncbi:MAG: O-antigen ligase family protein [Patescibacteria group bacterium]
MLKEYFWIAVFGVLLNAGLIFANSAGFFPMGLAAFAGAFLFFLVISLKKPAWVFWIFIILIPLERVIISSQEIPFSLRPFQFVGIALIFALIIKFFFRVAFFRKISFSQKVAGFQKTISKIKTLSDKQDYLVFIFIAIAAFSISNAPNREVSLKQFLVLLSFGALYVLSRYFFQQKNKLQEALWFFVATSLPVLIFGLYQAVAPHFNWPDFQIFSGRVNSTFAEPDWFGVYLVFLAAIIYWLKLQLFKTNNETMVASWELRKAGQWAANIYLSFVFLVLLLTVARSAWAGFAGITVIYFFLLWRQGRIYFQKRLYPKKFFREGLSLSILYAVSMALILVFNLSQFHFLNRAGSSLSGMEKITISCNQGSSVPDKINKIDELNQYECEHIKLEEISEEKEKGKLVREVFRPDPNVEIRKEIYAKTWQSIKKHPLIGQGLGSSSEILGEDDHGHGYNASNIFLEVWISTGLAGLAVFCGLFLWPAFTALRLLMRNSKLNYGLNIFIILSTAAFLVPNLFNAGVFLGVFWVWLAIIAGYQTSSQKVKTS